MTDAPDWHISDWINTPTPLSLEMLRGQVVVACAFQMLCPGCVSHAVPQMKKLHQLFEPHNVAVIMLHTVFEHHDAMTATALRAFVHEYGIRFPVGIDTPGENGDPMPLTMKAYQMQGTPTILLIDREGRLRLQVLGHIEDMQLGAETMSLMKQ